MTYKQLVDYLIKEWKPRDENWAKSLSEIKDKLEPYLLKGETRTVTTRVSRGKTISRAEQLLDVFGRVEVDNLLEKEQEKSVVGWITKEMLSPASEEVLGREISNEEYRRLWFEDRSTYLKIHKTIVGTR